MSPRKGDSGFTLIDSWIVVAIVGVGWRAAVYGVRKYLLNAKTAESAQRGGSNG